MTQELKQDFFFLSPVLVVRVTKENLEQVAEWCGGEVQETESRRKAGEMDKYVWVPTPKSSNTPSWAFPGMFVTKRLVLTMKNELKATWAVFRRDYFDKNYFDSPEAAFKATWDRQHEIAPEPVVVNVSVGEAMHDATLKKIQEIARQSGGNVTINVSQEQPFSHKEAESPQTLHVEDAPAGELAVFEHNHVLDDACEIHDCKVDRYLDGVHVFTDKTVVAEPGQDPIVRQNEMAGT